jgi:hypothetical protein
VANALSKTYGDVNPTLTYTATGLVNNDTLSGSLATAATQYSDVGSYVIGLGSLNNANYAISYTGANLTVNQRALSVAADALSKTYGDANPTLTYIATGLVNNDTLTGSLATTATQYSNVGAYAITQGSLLASANYRLSFIPGVLTVEMVASSVPGTQASLLVAAFDRDGFIPLLSVSSDMTQSEDGQILITDPRFDGTLVCLDNNRGHCVWLPSQAGL